MRKLAAVLLAISLFVPAAWAKEETVSGTRVRLDVPSGFVLTDRFAGFIQEETGASLMVLEMPGAPVEKTLAGITPKTMAAEGIKLIGKENMSFGNLRGALFHVSLQGQDRVFLKWHAIFGDKSSTTMVLGTFPKDQEPAMSPILRRAVLSARVAEAAKPSSRGFTVREGGELKNAQEIQGGLLLTGGGVFPVPDTRTPRMIIAASLSQGMKVPDQKEFARRRFMDLAGLRNHEAVKIEPVSIDGLQGYAISGKGVDDKTQDPMAVYQVMLYDRDGYYVIYASVHQEASQRHWLSFLQIAKSFKRTR